MAENLGWVWEDGSGRVLRGGYTLKDDCGREKWRRGHGRWIERDGERGTDTGSVAKGQIAKMNKAWKKWGIERSAQSELKEKQTNARMERTPWSPLETEGIVVAEGRERPKVTEIWRAKCIECEKWQVGRNETRRARDATRPTEPIETVNGVEAAVLEARGCRERGARRSEGMMQIIEAMWCVEMEPIEVRTVTIWAE